MQRRLAAEALGTFWLVFGGCGSAVLAAAFPDLGIGFFGVAMAFGLTVLTMAYAVGGISGGHFNPAVTVGLTVAGKSDANALIPYIIAQLVGAVLAATTLYVIASGKAGVDLGGFAANGYGEHSPGGYSMISGFRAGNRADGVLPDRHSGLDPWPRAQGLCPHRHRPGADADPPDRDSGDQYLGQPGAFDQPGAVCRRLGHRPAVDVLGRPDSGRRDRRA
jgi:hypothetical protein